MNLLTRTLSLILACTSLAAADDTMDSDTKPIVIIGASYAASWPIETLAGHPVVNMGIDGNQSFEMLERFERDVLFFEPAKVLIWGFINDIFRSDLDKVDATKDRIRRDFEDMVNAAEMLGIEVILATEVSIREPAGFMNWVASVAGRLLGKSSYQDMINGHVHDVNQQLISFVASRGTIILDFETLLADSDGNRKSEFAIEDGSHLTSAAYEVMTAYTRDTLHAENLAKEVE